MHTDFIYGWQPDQPDDRDALYSPPTAVMSSIPDSVDLRQYCPEVYFQGCLGSCTAQAIAAALEYNLTRERMLSFTPSRLFIYYNAREIMGTVGIDSGAYLRAGLRAVNKKGVCPEVLWPYAIHKFADKPHTTCYEVARNGMFINYYRLPRQLTQMKSCLAEGYPFIFGFSMFESFEFPLTANNGEGVLPHLKERFLGGHAAMAVGYNNTKQYFLVRNSRGTNWGDNGYFTLPYEYFLREELSNDFWTIRF